MTVQELGSIGEFVGAVAIIISLIYVGLQIRQNTQATRAATSQAFIDSHGAVAFKIIESDFRDVYARGLRGLSNLQEGDLISFILWCQQAWRIWEIYYYQWQAGFFEPQLWQGFKAQLRDLHQFPGLREAWALRKHQFSTEFAEFVDSLILSADEMPIYGRADG